MVIGGGGTSAPSNQLFFNPPQCRVITGVGAPDPVTGKRPPVYVQRMAPWSANRDAANAYGFAAFTVDPGTRRGGTTSITVTYYEVIGTDGQLHDFETFTLQRRRRDYRRRHGRLEITIARNYTLGAAGHLHMDRLPLTGEYTTYAVQKTDPTLPDYVPTPPPPGTGWATGEKTYDGPISGRPTARPSRRCSSGPRGTATHRLRHHRQPRTPRPRCSPRTSSPLLQGTADIDSRRPDHRQGQRRPRLHRRAEREHQGRRAARWRHPYFDQTIRPGSFAGLTVAQQAQEAGLPGRHGQRLRRSPPRGRPVPSRSSDVRANNVDPEYTARRRPRPAPHPTRCRVTSARTAPPHPDPRRRPRSTRSTKRTRGHHKGFFLQVEGASIDKQDHAANPCGQIGETARVRPGRDSGARLPPAPTRTPDRRHRRPRPHQPDRRGRPSRPA